MSKTLMLAAVLLLSAAWLQAQQTPDANSPNSGQGSSQMGSDSGSAQTVQGCLSGSSGNYTLTSDSGTAYQLAGDTSKLSEHVGHEIQIKGTTSGSSASAGASGSSASSASGGAVSGSSGSTLTVNSVKHVSKTCTNASK